MKSTPACTPQFQVSPSQLRFSKDNTKMILDERSPSANLPASLTKFSWQNLKRLSVTVDIIYPPITKVRSSFPGEDTMIKIHDKAQVDKSIN